jgi:hypothetical protein
VPQAQVPRSELAGSGQVRAGTRAHEQPELAGQPPPGPLAACPRLVGAGGQVGEPGGHQRVVRQRGLGGRAAGRAIVGCG